VTHEFADITECVKRQAEIEQHLKAAGYQLVRSASDRRREPGTWHGPDHRRRGGELMISESPLSDTLFWSKRGDVACRIHAPDPQSDRWKIDNWCEIPGEVSKRHGLAYQCPRCAPDGRLHRHLRAAEREANGIRRSA
jgi:hypothetical protein